MVPKSAENRYRFVKIKDVPGSRSLSEALGWMAVMVVLPLFAGASGPAFSIVMAALVVFSFSYARAILFSLFQLQGDLMVGAETLPITLGEKQTLTLFKVFLLATAVLLIASALLGLVGAAFYTMLIPLGTLMLCLLAYERQWLSTGVGLEALVEGNFLLTGLIVLVQ